ncbi:SDR family oxidoreductase [Sulfitobacter sp. HNIBRBA2951]|uniref:SDR family NAD(P)-dependent oxidoreductase n=1 Tax=Sulfitobacter aquimarinus TaxID=3158557 RepID=UPI0032DF8583
MQAIFPDLKDKSVFITGGGSGIGAELTDGFMAQGAKVAFVQRSPAGEFCDAMEEKHGQRPMFMPCDISNTDSLKAAIAQADEAHGPVTILINNAANDARHTTEQVDEEMWEKNTGVNLKPYFFACQTVAQNMRAAGGGAIVNMSSISYIMGNGDYPLYVMANGGITALTRGLARELGPDGIRVNALAPGWVKTDKQAREHGFDDVDVQNAHLEKQCLKRVIAPEDIVGPVLFLASDTSAMMTGQLMAVDGGVVVTG